ncbi:MAG: YciI family protein [Thermoanaerobaculia bacterium]
MRRLFAASLLLLFSAAALALPEGPGGFEMATYQVGFLKRGPAWTPADTPELQELQKAHLAHIGKMAETGKLLVAGPFADDGDLRGMFIFRTDTLEEAKALAEQDPAVKAGRLVIEWHPWYAAKNIQVTPKAPPAK